MGKCQRDPEKYIDKTADVPRSKDVERALYRYMLLSLLDSVCQCKHRADASSCVNCPCAASSINCNRKCRCTNSCKNDRLFSMTNRVLVVRVKETNRIVCQLNRKTENESVPAENTKRHVPTSVGANIATMENRKHVLARNEVCASIHLLIKERRCQNSARI